MVSLVIFALSSCLRDKCDHSFNNTLHFQDGYDMLQCEGECRGETVPEAWEGLPLMWTPHSSTTHERWGTAFSSQGHWTLLTQTQWRKWCRFEALELLIGTPCGFWTFMDMKKCRQSIHCGQTNWPILDKFWQMEGNGCGGGKKQEACDVQPKQKTLSWMKDMREKFSYGREIRMDCCAGTFATVKAFTPLPQHQ